MRLSDAGPHQRQTKALYPNHRSPPWLTEDATRDRSNRLLDVSQRVELEPLIEVIQQEVVIPTARALASNYTRATERRPQRAMPKRASKNGRQGLSQFPGGHLKLKVDVWTAIVPFPISEAAKRDVSTGDSGHQRNHRRHFCGGGAARLELNSEATHISSNDQAERRAGAKRMTGRKLLCSSDPPCSYQPLPRDRSSRWLDCRATPAPKLPPNGAAELNPAFGSSPGSNPPG